jgi:tetratricopeptide (TPR) repeat protein
MDLKSPLPSCYLADLGRAQYQAGRFEEAIATYDRMPLSEYGASEHVYRAASYIGLDRNEAARKEIAKAMTIDPDTSLKVWRRRPFKSAECMERFLDALREAGMPG